jgi:hypothetical protein
LRRTGEKAKLFRCRKCGYETTENATRFAQHILKCSKSTEEDRLVASEHEALTEKRRQMRKAKRKQTEDSEPEDGSAGEAGPSVTLPSLPLERTIEANPLGSSFGLGGETFDSPTP